MKESYRLCNEELQITVKAHGAELSSMKDVKTGKDYLWKGDPEFWGRQAPILFPVVGGLKRKQYTYKQKTYAMNQHGFARDMDFTLKEQTKDSLWFSLSENEESYAMYPFHFTLELGYQLIGRTVKVLWRVVNTGEEDLYFSIGGHPAFNCPMDEGHKREEYFIQMKGKDTYTHRLIDMETGLASNKFATIETNDGIFSFKKELFEGDALVFEGEQTKEISLLTPDKVPYVTVKFDAPLVGVWTNSYKEAPFLCIEPWYGRCDGVDFEGTLEERAFGNRLATKEVFKASYDILLG